MLPGHSRSICSPPPPGPTLQPSTCRACGTSRRVCPSSRHGPGHAYCYAPRRACHVVRTVSCSYRCVLRPSKTNGLPAQARTLTRRVTVVPHTPLVLVLVLASIQIPRSLFPSMRCAPLPMVPATHACKIRRRPKSGVTGQIHIEQTALDSCVQAQRWSRAVFSHWAPHSDQILVQCQAIWFQQYRATSCLKLRDRATPGSLSNHIAHSFASADAIK